MCWTTIPARTCAHAHIVISLVITGSDSLSVYVQCARLPFQDELVLRLILLSRRRGDLVVCVGLRSERSGVRSSLRSPCCKLEQYTIIAQKLLVIPRKRCLRPDMTVKLLTGT